MVANTVLDTCFSALRLPLPRSYQHPSCLRPCPSLPLLQTHCERLIPALDVKSPPCRLPYPHLAPGAVFSALVEFRGQMTSRVQSLSWVADGRAPPCVRAAPVREPDPSSNTQCHLWRTTKSHLSLIIYFSCSLQ